MLSINTMNNKVKNINKKFINDNEKYKSLWKLKYKIVIPKKKVLFINKLTNYIDN